MKHPYCIGDEEKINKLVEVEVEGEFKDGVPHGLCQMFYIYSNEYNDIFPDDDPKLNAHYIYNTFRGTGTFVNGQLQGPAVFFNGQAIT